MPAQSHIVKMMRMESLTLVSLLSLKRSLYRDLLFLALVALGKNNINIGKFKSLISLKMFIRISMVT